MTRKPFFILFEELILHLSTRPNLPSIQRTFAPGPVPSATCPRQSVLPVRLLPDFSFVLEGYDG
jgi:hypothetical protein